MDGTHHLTMGDRGRLVIPAEVRARWGLDTGTPVVLVEASGGLVVLTRDQLRSRVRDDLADRGLLAELLADPAP